MNPTSCTPIRLRTEYLENPLGMDEPCPRFSWQMEDDRPGAVQTAYQIMVFDNGRTVWDSGKVENGRSIQVEYRGEALRPKTRYDWQVRVWDRTGQPGDWSQAFFETGFLGTPWQARWIANPLNGVYGQPPACFRRAFHLNAGVRRARLYATSLGVYKPMLNGLEITTNCLMPGWTDYYHRVQYQAYDVTEFLKSGNNVIDATLGEGWCCGRIARYKNWIQFGKITFSPDTALLMQLEIEQEDGSNITLSSDESWLYHTEGPLRVSDFYDGENYDARMTSGNWRKPPVITPDIEVVWNHGVPVRRHEKLAPKAITYPQPGVAVVDFGQNLAGRERIRIDIPKDGMITIRHGEMLREDGMIYTDNLRSARATSVFISDGRPHVYEPTFPFYGFRYLEIHGWPGELDPADVDVYALYSDIERTGFFECSDPMLNQLYSNVIWGQRSNYVDVPTDCPQRDERLGWTGDAQVFILTAAYNTDVAAFFTKWLADLDSSRNDNGEYPPWAPFHDRDRKFVGVAGWADAGIICPWVIYQMYGDTRILEKYYDSMCRWIRFQEANSEHLIRSAAHYKDWLNIDAETPADLIATAFFAYGSELMGRIARVLGKTGDAAAFDSLHQRICEAYCKRFLTPGGELTVKTQTAAILTLHFGLIPKSLHSNILNFLVHDISVSRNNHLSTGFLGTPYLAQTLSDHGKTGLAYRLVTQTTYPSWLYSVTQGATTIWERWNSWTKAEGFGDVQMNSFNHYAYGSIMDWFYGAVCGIRPCPDEPAFKRFILAPLPDSCLKYARAEFHSPCGKIVSGWHRDDAGNLRFEFRVPPNTEAEIHFPNGTRQTLPAGRHTFPEPQPVLNRA